MLLLAVVCGLSFFGSEQLLPVAQARLLQHKPDALLRRGDRLGVTQLIVPAEVPADNCATRRD